MNLNRLRLGQKSRKKNYKIKSCQNDMIECNCDNLHTFTYSVFLDVTLQTHLHTYIKIGTWGPKLVKFLDLGTELGVTRTTELSSGPWIAGSRRNSIELFKPWRYFGWMKFENLHFALEFTKSFWFFKNHKYSVQPRFPLLCHYARLNPVHSIP